MKIAILLLVLSASSFAQQPKTILLSVRAENEGPEGLWVQSGKDLAAPELAKLQELLGASFSIDKNIRLVETEDKRDHVEILVSVTKVPRGNGAWFYAASSVIGVATLKGDEFVSHNVVVCETISAVAKAIGFSFASIRLRLALSLPNSGN